MTNIAQARQSFKSVNKSTKKKLPRGQLKNGAGEEIRTLDILLGKEAFYH